MAKKRDKTPVDWDSDSIEAFEDCKRKLINVTMLAFPDKKADLRLVTDASDLSMGGALIQCESVIIEGCTKKIWKPLGFFSCKFNNAQKNTQVMTTN